MRQVHGLPHGFLRLLCQWQRVRPRPGPARKNPPEDFDWERYYVKLRLKDRKEEGGEYGAIGIGGEGR